MEGDESQRIRHELRETFTESQVDLLRALRAELSSRRWQVMLEIDAAQEEIGALQRKAGDPDWAKALAAVQLRLQNAHGQLAHIPEDVIPAF